MLRRMFWERAKGELGLRVEIWRLRARDANEQSKVRHGYGQLSSLGHRHEAASMKKAMADHGGEWRREVLEVTACRMLPMSRPLHRKRRVETVFASVRSVHTIAVAVSTQSQLQYLPLVLFWPCQPSDRLECECIFCEACPVLLTRNGVLFGHQERRRAGLTQFRLILATWVLLAEEHAILVNLLLQSLHLQSRLTDSGVWWVSGVATQL